MPVKTKNSAYFTFRTVTFGFFLTLFCAGLLISCGRKSAIGGKSDQKFGYVDVATILEDYKKIEAYDKEMATVGKAKEDEREVFIKDIQKLKDEFALLSEQGKAEREKDLDEKIKALQEFDNKAKEELSGKRNEYLKEIFDDIDKVVDDLADKEGFDFVFSSRSLLFQKEQFNVTQPVVRELNRRYERNLGSAA